LARPEKSISKYLAGVTNYQQIKRDDSRIFNAKSSVSVVESIFDIKIFEINFLFIINFLVSGKKSSMPRFVCL